MRRFSQHGAASPPRHSTARPLAKSAEPAVRSGPALTSPHGPARAQQTQDLPELLLLPGPVELGQGWAKNGGSQYSGGDGVRGGAWGGDVSRNGSRESRATRSRFAPRFVWPAGPARATLFPVQTEARLSCLFRPEPGDSAVKH
ncbi:hypothetical protein SKAU_G00429470 [Synaphobranchus kaupii]|uniref:Uncharacterized protein n=1 Tax=Synaphobranchus kaupii TaxID=118154 RepID=A0A9Q1IA41_SYNKA|nr:hypothetical protein SKAU_G00429470 [Synaphobranchus kaupii]